PCTNEAVELLTFEDQTTTTSETEEEEQ
ncbi:MAG: hypothetical protein EZS28_016069, partial [Streblomastix strix]